MSEEQSDSDTMTSPLDQKVLECIRSCRTKDNKFVIRPARLAAALGMSIEDATAELCGLMRAVGGGFENGASFTFETLMDETTPTTTTTTMVFTFPLDFARRANRARRNEDLMVALNRLLTVAFKMVQVIVAFGLILSLFLVCVAGTIAMVAVLIAMSRSGGGGESYARQQLLRRMRSMAFTLRQVLWFWALLGPGSRNGEDVSSFTSSVQDASLFLGVCCGNPLSPWFWWQATMLQRRQRSRSRGWSRRVSVFGRNGHEQLSPLVADGVVSDVREGTWSRAEMQRERAARLPLAEAGSENEYRGLLSVLVEFLFGPTPFNPGPLHVEKWKVRHDVIVSLSSKASSSSAGIGVSLAQLLPYSDRPPLSEEGLQPSHPMAIAEALLIVAYFNGVPASPKGSHQGSHARFVFPELMAEAVDGTMVSSFSDNEVDDSWRSFFFVNPASNPQSDSSRRKDTTLPKYLRERRHVATTLPQSQFGQCCILCILNYVGILWIQQSIRKGGIIELPHPYHTVIFGFFSLLRTYAKMFFLLPMARMVVLAILNISIDKRNKRRHILAELLTSNDSPTTDSLSLENST